jgi:predicted protein tyrosine phosphatase
MCQGGNSRSVACGYLLKYKYGIDTLACGWEGNRPETCQMLFAWADLIVVMQEAFLEHVPKKFRKKVLVIDVGPDVWCNSLHPELLAKIDELLTPHMTIVSSDTYQGELQSASV